MSRSRHDEAPATAGDLDQIASQTIDAPHATTARQRAAALSVVLTAMAIGSEDWYPTPELLSAVAGLSIAVVCDLEAAA